MTTSINSNVPTRPLTVELTGNSLIDKETIAASLDTLPEFVSYTQGSQTVYILDDIINQHIKEENIDFRSLVNTVKLFFPEIDELTVLKLWIATSNITDSNLLFYIQTEIGSLLDISTFMNYDSKDFLEVIESKREQNKRKVLKRQSDKTSFGKGIPSTQIFPTSRTFKIVPTRKARALPVDLIPVSAWTSVASSPASCSERKTFQVSASSLFSCPSLYDSALSQFPASTSPMSALPAMKLSIGRCSMYVGNA